jgi:hypothetical protein
MEKLNAFMLSIAGRDQHLRQLIPDYIDTLAQFIANINEVGLFSNQDVF